MFIQFVTQFRLVINLYKYSVTNLDYFVTEQSGQGTC